MLIVMKTMKLVNAAHITMGIDLVKITDQTIRFSTHTDIIREPLIESLNPPVERYQFQAVVNEIPQKDAVVVFITGQITDNSKLGLARIMYELATGTVKGTIDEFYFPSSLDYFKGRFTDVTLGWQNGKMVAGVFFAADGTWVP